MIKQLLFKLFGLYTESEVVKTEIDLRNHIDTLYHELEKERNRTNAEIRTMANGEIENLEARVRQMAPGKLFEVELRDENPENSILLKILAVRSSGGITHITAKKL